MQAGGANARSGESMLQVENEVEIQTPPSRVWCALVDFTRYQEWNPFIAVRGTPGTGLDIEWSLGGYGRKRVWTKAVITAHEDPRLLAWSFAVGRLFSLEEAYSLTDAHGRTLLRHSFRCTGLIPVLAKSFLRKRLNAVLSAADGGLREHLSASATPSKASEFRSRRLSIGAPRRRGARAKRR